jgi:hypothetical protein
VYVLKIDTKKKVAVCHWFEKTWKTVRWPKKDTVAYDKWWNEANWEKEWRRKSKACKGQRPPESEYMKHWSSEDQPFRNFVPVHATFHVPPGTVALVPASAASVKVCESVKLPAAFMNGVMAPAFRSLGCIRV